MIDIWKESVEQAKESSRKEKVEKRGRTEEAFVSGEIYEIILSDRLEKFPL